MTKTTTKTAAKTAESTVVSWPADRNVIPHYIDVPPELQPLAEAARAALMRWREAGVHERAARDALEAAPAIDRAAEAQAGPDAMPERTEPLRRAEYGEARRVHAAAEAKYKQAIREQSAAIGPLHADWLDHHGQQVDARIEKATGQLAALLETFAELEADLNLDRALRDYSPSARFGWWFDWRHSHNLEKARDKAAERLRKSIQAAVVPNEVPALLGALQVHATAWRAERENERQVQDGARVG